MPVTVAVDSTGQRRAQERPRGVASEDRQDPRRRGLRNRGPMPKAALRPSSGSSDALWLARDARRAQRPLLVLAASAQDAERLREEIAWFDPHAARAPPARLGDPALRPVLAAPGPGLRAPRHALAVRRAAHFDVGIVPVTTALQRLPPRRYLAGRTFHLKAGATPRPRRRCARSSSLAGYAHVQQVMRPGEFCVRGGLIDLFPTGSAVPYRIDLLGDEIETIRTFDVDTQRSHLPGARGAPAAGARVPARRGRARALPRLLPRALRGRSVAARASTRTSPTASRPAGVECVPAAVLRRRPRRIFDYLPDETTCVMHGDVPEAADRRSGGPQVALRPAARRPRPAAARAARALPAGRGPVRRAQARSRASSCDAAGARRSRCPRSRSTGARSSRCASCKRFAEPLRGPRADRRRGRGPARDAVAVLRRARLPSGAGRRLGALPRVRASGRDRPTARSHAGFVLPDEQLAVITEAELYPGRCARRAARDARARTSAEGMLRDLAEVKVGDPGRAQPARHRPLPRARHARPGRRRRRSSCTSNTTAATSSTCRSRSCT